MDLDHYASRRAALAAAGAGGAVVGLSEVSPAGAAAARRNRHLIQRQIDRVLVGRTSSNGWQMERGSDIGGRIWTRPVPGTGGVVQVCAGDVEAVLVRLAASIRREDELPGGVVGVLR